MRLMWRQQADPARAAVTRADLALINEKLDTIIERLPTAENLLRAIVREHSHKEATK